MRKFTKLFTTKATSIDDTKKSIRFKISDNQPDRMDEVVDQDSWDFKNYMNNPVVLWGHNPDEPENVLGQTVALATEGGETYAEMQFDDDINPKASLVWKQLLKGTLRTVSVGFIAHEIEGNVLKNNELLEISVVPIPANPRAIALSYKAGEMSKKDASWLMDSMKREADYLEQQMKSQDNHKEKDMEKVEEMMSTLVDLVGKQGEQIASLTETVQALTNEKTEDQADDDQRDAQTGAEDVKNDDEGKEDEDLAKGGDNDQSGAENEIDLDAELTPELEAQIEAELAEAA